MKNIYENQISSLIQSGLSSSILFSSLRSFSTSSFEAFSVFRRKQNASSHRLFGFIKKTLTDNEIIGKIIKISA